MDELNRRKRIFDNLKVFGWGLYIMAAFVFLLVYTNETIQGFLILGTLVFLGTAVLFICKIGIKAISQDFKNTIIRKEIKRILPNSTFDPNKGISSAVVAKSNLIKLHEVYKSEDLIQGKIKDVRFQFSDVHVIDVRSSGKHTTRITTFQGRVYVFDFNKRFRSNVFLLQPGEYRPFTGYAKIQLESMHFNSEFKIYTDNEHDAFYILTPHFMEKLLELDRAYRDQIRFSFLNNKLYIAIDSRTDTFDVLGFGKITTKDIDKAVLELERIVSFVEFLKLDNNMFIQK